MNPFDSVTIHMHESVVQKRLTFSGCCIIITLVTCFSITVTACNFSFRLIQCSISASMTGRSSDFMPPPDTVGSVLQWVSMYGSISYVCLSVCVCACGCAEIKAMPDLNLESDMKLDKLESFIGKLNSKGQSRLSHQLSHCEEMFPQ